MKTKEEILNTFNTPEGAYWAYRQGLQEGFADMQNALRNQAAIAAMQGYICAPVVEGINPNPSYKEIAEKAVILADELIKQLKGENTEKDETQVNYDEINIREIVKYVVKHSNTECGLGVRLVNAFHSNNINTVADLLRIGKREFKRMNGIGFGSVSWVSDALYSLYGITIW